MSDLPEILLLDDDPKELDRVSALISAYFAKSERIVLPARNLRQFISGSDALEYFLKGALVDIAFLDIIMPEMSGVQFAGRIRDKGYRGYIVFLTSSNDFASESFMVGAFSYLLKPVVREQLFNVLRKIKEDRARVQTEDNASVFIQTRQYSRNIFLREIVYAEIMGRKLFIHLANDEIISFNKPLKEIAPDLLADKRFSHCHNSIIVNMDKIGNIRENDVLMKNGSVVPISRRFREFKSRYIAWSLHRQGGEK